MAFDVVTIPRTQRLVATLAAPRRVPTATTAADSMVGHGVAAVGDVGLGSKRGVVGGEGPLWTLTDARRPPRGHSETTANERLEMQLVRERPVRRLECLKPIS